MKMTVLNTLFLCLFFALCLPVVYAQDDWVTYQHDNRRSGTTTSNIHTPLEQLWVYESPEPPQSAWSDTAKWDSYANIKDMKSMRNFDPVFYTIAVGDYVYWSSSVDDAVHCVEAKTGKPVWKFYSNSPVRMPPAYDDGKLYFGSDDGYAYCINAETRELIWREKPQPDSRVMPNNGKLISPYPCRTGVMVQNGIAYFSMSLLPWNPSYLCAVDAKTGKAGVEGTFIKKVERMTFQGAILASPTKLYFPQGRQQPIVADRGSGEVVGGFGQSGQGGVFALLTPDEEFVYGGGRRKAGGFQLEGFNAETRDRLATFPNATSMVVMDEIAYIHTGDQLHAFDRNRYHEVEAKRMDLTAQKEAIEKKIKKLGETNVSDEKAELIEVLELTKDELQKVAGEALECILWRTESDHSHALIAAGDKLISGGVGEVAVLDIKTGDVLAEMEVEGKVYGFSAARGQLYVSTDTGHIYAFGKM